MTEQPATAQPADTQPAATTETQPVQTSPAAETPWPAPDPATRSTETPAPATGQPPADPVADLASALGLDGDDPAQAIRQLAAQAAADRRTLQIIRACPADIDPAAILDSRAATTALDGLDGDRLSEAIARLAADRPGRYHRQTAQAAPAGPAPAAADTRTTPTPPAAPSIDDWLRAH